MFFLFCLVRDQLKPRCSQGRGGIVGVDAIDTKLSEQGVCIKPVARGSYGNELPVLSPKLESNFLGPDTHHNHVYNNFGKLLKSDFDRAVYSIVGVQSEIADRACWSKAEHGAIPFISPFIH